MREALALLTTLGGAVDVQHAGQREVERDDERGRNRGRPPLRRAPPTRTDDPARERADEREPAQGA